MTQKEEDHDTLLEIKGDVKYLIKTVEEINGRKAICDAEFVKKNEFEPIQTAYYVARKCVIVALISGILTAVVFHARLF